MTPHEQKIEDQLLSFFEEKEKWDKHQEETPRAIYDMAQVFLRHNNKKGMKELFERTPTARKPSLLTHVFVQSNKAKSKGDRSALFITVPLQNKFLKAPYKSVYQDEDIEHFCRLSPKADHLSFLETFGFLDTVAPWWKQENTRQCFKHTNTFFCNANITKTDRFANDNPNFLPEIQAFVDFVNRRSTVITREMMPYFFALKEKTEILKEIDLSQKHSQKPKML